MSKKAQDSTTKECSAVAKPRPMNLVSRNLLSAKKDPPQDSSDPNSQRQETDAKHQPQPNKVFSRERQQDDTQSSSTRKLGRRDELSSLARARKLRTLNRKVKDGIPQHADLRPLIPEESLQEPAKRVEFRRRSTSNWC